MMSSLKKKESTTQIENKNNSFFNRSYPKRIIFWRYMPKPDLIDWDLARLVGHERSVFQPEGNFQAGEIAPPWAVPGEESFRVLGITLKELLEHVTR